MQRLPRANLSSNALGLTVPHGLLVLADEVIDPFVAFKRVTISVAIGGIAEMPTSEPTRMTQLTQLTQLTHERAYSPVTCQRKGDSLKSAQSAAGGNQ